MVNGQIENGKWIIVINSINVPLYTVFHVVFLLSGWRLYNKLNKFNIGNNCQKKLFSKSILLYIFIIISKDSKTKTECKNLSEDEIHFKIFLDNFQTHTKSRLFFNST